MDVEGRKALRSRVLEAHYELSKGSLWTGVLRPDLAKRLGIDNYNDDDLLNAIKYLEDKGFLKVGTNVHDNITTAGVDEVEDGFPTLGKPQGDASNGALTLVAKIEHAEKLAGKGLLKEDERSALSTEVNSFLESNLDLNSELGRTYDKDRRSYTVWTTPSRGGYTHELGRLPGLKRFLEQYLDLKGVKAPRQEIFIKQGDTYTARQHVRAILTEAKRSIDIQDNYIGDPDFLNIVQPYVSQNPNLRLRILTGRTDQVFVSDIKQFQGQYPNTEVRRHANCHDRFIITDGSQVYHSGHSFKDLGKKASAITKFEDSGQTQGVIDNFEDWWQNGTPV
jgi:hypothetical protein